MQGNSFGEETSSNLLHVLLPAFSTAVLVGQVTLRLMKPECDLDEAWGQEDLDTATQRTVGLLHMHTVPHREGKGGGEDTHAGRGRDNSDKYTSRT